MGLSSRRRARWKQRLTRSSDRSCCWSPRAPDSSSLPSCPPCPSHPSATPLEVMVDEVLLPSLYRVEMEAELLLFAQTP